MANVVHSPIDLHLRPAKAGFGFGFASSSKMPGSSWPTSSPQLSPFQQLTANGGSMSRAAASTPSKSRKRAYEDDGEDSREVLMENRTPTPTERPKKELKRLRQSHSTSEDKEKSAQFKSQAEPDIGLLLATLPSSALLPILLKLVAKHPSLGSEILPLIPRPSLEAALQALDTVSKKLASSYPYSNPPQAGLFSQGIKPSWGSSSSTGFGFGQNSGNGMSEEYIRSRIQPTCAEFVNACAGCLPYFSQVADQHSSTLSKERCHPSETFMLLSAITRHMLSQPALTQNMLMQEFKERMGKEWTAWVDRVDDYVNREGGMFGSETVAGWVRDLDEFAGAKNQDASSTMRMVKERWLNKVGWLIGKPGQPMDV